TRNKSHVHTLGESHLVRVNLWENHLLRQAKAVIAVPVEALGVDAAEVADTRQGDADESVEKLIHPLAAQSHPTADLVALTQAESAHRLAGLGDLGPLAGDLGQLVSRLLHAILILQGLPHTHVNNNLLESWQTERVLTAELFRKLRHNFLFVTIKQASHR